MKEVLRAKPRINRDDQRSWSYASGEDAKMYIAKSWPEAGEVSPLTHPKIADLCAGDGSVAGIFCESGWDPRNILCVDRYRSLTPVVQGVTWGYWDVTELGRRLLHKGSIPPEVSQYQGLFDIVVHDLSGIRRELRQVVCDYLVRPGGLIHHSDGIERED